MVRCVTIPEKEQVRPKLLQRDAAGTREPILNLESIDRRARVRMQEEECSNSWLDSPCTTWDADPNPPRSTANPSGRLLY